jgi:hypothetical protein
VRVFRWREIGRITLSQYAGNLDSILRRSYAEAKKAVKQFSTIGDPGCGKDPTLLRGGLGLTAGVERLTCLTRLAGDGYRRITGPPIVRYGLHWSPSFRQIRTGSCRHIFCRESIGRVLCKDKAPLCHQFPSRADAITLQTDDSAHLACSLKSPQASTSELEADRNQAVSKVRGVGLSVIIIFDAKFLRQRGGNECLARTVQSR